MVYLKIIRMIRPILYALTVGFHGIVFGTIILVAQEFDLVKSPLVTALIILAISFCFILFWVLSGWGLKKLTGAKFRDALRVDAYFYFITWFLVLMLPSFVFFNRWSKDDILYGFLAIFISAKLSALFKLYSKREKARVYSRFPYYLSIAGLYASLTFIVSFDARLDLEYMPYLAASLIYALLLQLLIHDVIANKLKIIRRWGTILTFIGLVIALPAFMYSAPMEEIMVKGIVKKWQKPGASIKDNPKFSQLKASIKGDTRTAFILPVNHSINRGFSVSENEELRFSIGIRSDPDNKGYQLGVFAVDEKLNKHRLTVQYMDRKDSRWINLRIDLRRFEGQAIKVIVQVNTWLGDKNNTAAGPDNSYLFLSEPYIVKARSRAENNVILILVDTLRADHLPIYGYKLDTAPHLSKLSQNAVVFENVMSQASWTSPSVASIFTSMMSSEHGVLSSYSLRLKPDNLALAEILKDEGYFTKGISANPLISEATFFDQGFTSFEEVPAKYMVYRSTDIVVSKTLKWLDQRKNTDPFFMYVHFIDPHDPYLAPRPFTFQTKKWNLSNVSQTLLYMFLQPSGYGMYGVGRTNTLYPGQVDNMRDRYDGEIKYIDQAISQIFRKLEERSLLNNTLVILTSDHGEEFLEHGDIKHGATLYQETIHVPLIMFFPNGKWSGKRLKAPARSIDISPTILDFLKVEQPETFRGESLLPIISGSETQDRLVISELYSVFNESLRAVSVTSDGYKLIKSFDEKANSTLELFSLGDDPGEKVNIIQHKPELVRVLENMVQEHLKKYNVKPGQPRKGKLDTEIIDRLKAIQYFR